MKIADILRQKGSSLITILPTDSIAVAARTLAENRVGALVVRDRRGQLAGILSERDIVRALAGHGAKVLEMRVADLMTREVITCRPSDPVRDIMARMTLRRIRHVPVVEEGLLVGIVSIGDVLKSRLEEKSQEVAVLRDINLVKAS